MISDDEIIRDFGQKLKRERIKKKMTQTQLGEIVGADKSRISDYENGRRRCSITTAYRLADALNIPTSALLNQNVNSGENSATPEKRLTALLCSVGHAVIDWGFYAYSDSFFADYSTVHSIGLSEDAFGEALHKFDGLKNGAINSCDYINDAILKIAEECSGKLMESQTFLCNANIKIN